MSILSVAMRELGQQQLVESRELICTALEEGMKDADAKVRHFARQAFGAIVSPGKGSKKKGNPECQRLWLERGDETLGNLKPPQKKELAKAFSPLKKRIDSLTPATPATPATPQKQGRQSRPRWAPQSQPRLRSMA